MDKTTDLISSVFSIILSQDILFANQKGYNACLVVISLPALYLVPFFADQVGDDLQ